VREVAGSEEVLRRLAEDEDDDPECDDDRPAAEVARPDAVDDPGRPRVDLGRFRLGRRRLDRGLRGDAVGGHADTCVAVPGMPETLVGTPAVIAWTTSSCVVLSRS